MTTLLDVEHGTAWKYNDGGRAAAGYKGEAGDCVVRAITIACDENYGVVYRELSALMHEAGKPRSARNGIPRPIIRGYMAWRGWEWTPTMAIGTGCRVHLRADELPTGRIIVSLSGHLAAVIDGVVHDTHDPSRGGTRCVYGYWRRPGEAIQSTAS